MKKKIFALTLSVVMTGMALAGCGGSGAGSQSDGAVSYTHLTLPTICSV